MPSYVRGRTERKLSDKEIVDLYLSGLDSATVADRAVCDATTVLNLVRSAGHPVRPRGGRALPNRLPLTDKEIVRLYTVDGKTGPEIAAMLGCVASTIYKVLRLAGIKRRLTSDTSKATAAATAARKAKSKGPTP